MKLLTFISLAQARSRITPKETRNKAPTKISNEGLLKDVEQYSEDYMYERAQRLSCSKSGIEAALKRLHISQENTLEHPSNKKSWIYYEVMLFVLDYFEQNINGNIFYNWCKHTLLPSLKTKCVIIIDNARFRKKKLIQRLLNRHSHRILWPSPYSPDLNPMEKKWA